MAKRDPNKTARNKAIDCLQAQLRTLLPAALAELNYPSEASLNAFIGSKAGDFIDLKNDIIKSPEEYLSKWLAGLKKPLNTGRGQKMSDCLREPANTAFRKYTELFLRRSFLKHFDELSKSRPRVSEAEYWFGVNDAHYGLFVSPRFARGRWENDKSEIRAFTERYWTIGHVLKTGLCLPGEDRKYNLSDVDAYLNFFYAQVRLSKSPYQLEVADRYIQFVKKNTAPRDVPLLIPELRYGEDGRKHTYRLDYLIINPFTLDKIGFEFSPWSTHGQLAGKDKTLKVLNEEAKANFEAEMSKVRAYFSKFNIYTLTYTDSNLSNIDAVFSEMKNFLNTEAPPEQLSLNLIHDYFGMA
jgi:hypothetical protein